MIDAHEVHQCNKCQRRESRHVVAPSKPLCATVPSQKVGAAEGAHRHDVVRARVAERAAAMRRLEPQDRRLQPKFGRRLAEMLRRLEPRGSAASA